MDINYKKYTEHDLSIFQKRTVDFVVEQIGHLILEAAPGSGKTEILAILGRVINDYFPELETIFLAFNVSIVKELGEKLDGIDSFTINKLFFWYYREVMGYPKVDKNKYWHIVKLALRAGGVIADDPKERNKIEKNVKQASSIFRVDLTDLDDKEAMHETARLFSFELLPENKWHVYKAILAYGDLIGRHKNMKDVEKDIYNSDEKITTMLFTMHRKFQEEHSKIRAPYIDFDDQLWIPYINGWITPRFDFILIDELQDLNKLRRMCVYNAMKENARFVGVGDPNQAVYLFAGATCNSMDDIREDLGATVLPLSVVYRCPRTHVELAQEIVPELEVFDGAIEGTIDYNVPYCALGGLLKEKGEEFDGNTVVVSRRNAPLVSLAYRLISEKVPFILKGRDFGKTIKKVVKMIALSSNGKRIKQDFEWEKFPTFLQMWYSKQVQMLDSKGAEKPAYLLLDDKLESMQILYLNSIASDPFEFLEEIDEMFPEETANGHNTITLCSIHKAKGLERQSVFVIEYDKLPFSWKNITEEQAEQEINLLFVAITRSKNYLGLVNSPPKEDDELL